MASSDPPSDDDAKARMRRLMVKHAGHSAEAARELGISRMELSRRLRKLGMGKLPAEERARAAKRFRLTG